MKIATTNALPGSILLGNIGPPRWPNSAYGYLPPLRTEIGGALPHTLQSLELARVFPDTQEPNFQVVAAAMGGRVMLLSGGDDNTTTVAGTILAESKDYGLGGVALAVADLVGNDGLDEVIFAPIYSPIANSGGTVRSHLHVLNGQTLQELPGTSGGVQIGEANNDDFLGYGACGIAVADIPGTSITKAIFVTTLNGELVVFQQTNGVINTIPLFRAVVEGSLGGFNSIVIADLEPSFPPKPEVYIAGSSGIRRFDF